MSPSHGKRDFAVVTKSRPLRWGSCAGFLAWRCKKGAWAREHRWLLKGGRVQETGFPLELSRRASSLANPLILACLRLLTSRPINHKFVSFCTTKFALICRGNNRKLIQICGYCYECCCRLHTPFCLKASSRLLIFTPAPLPRRRLTMSRDVLFSWLGCTTGIYWVEARNAAKHLTIERPPSTPPNPAQESITQSRMSLVSRWRNPELGWLTYSKHAGSRGPLCSLLWINCLV